MKTLTNKVSVGAYRAPNAPQATFALESTVAELCSALKMDPLEFRKLNGLKEGDPSTDRRQKAWPSIGLQECLDALQKHPLWVNRDLQREAPAHLQGWKVGIGVAAGGLARWHRARSGKRVVLKRMVPLQSSLVPSILQAPIPPCR